MGCGKPEKLEDTLYKKSFISDYKQAIETAKTEKKHLLLNFTGSDFCPPCKLLKKNVFNTPQFIERANKQFVFVEIDFPQYKKLPETIQEQNMILGRKYKINSFPTIIIIDSNEKVLAVKSTYRGEGAEEYLATLEKAIKQSSI